MPNQLAGEISPYLLQHKDNPVDWRPWGPAALAEARARNVPVLLSVGYAACHWCHVMAHESFEDPTIAAVMNALFVNIKVDREERPDIDQIYQSALHMLGEQGGWPLTMFLSPDGAPFWGGAYFPNPARYGRPGFGDVLRRVSEVYRAHPETVAKNGAALTSGLRQLAETGRPGQVHRGHLDQVATGLLGNIDFEHGGAKGAPKFPHAPLLELLWRGYLRSGNKDMRRAVLVTLTHMCQGGIYDHLGGGFARYSTDDRWLAPHFEKMLYDNAQLVEILTLVWQQEKSPLFAARIAETVGWLLREMVNGGFAATQDADSEGVEGKFHVWTRSEIDARLNDPEFNRIYDVTEAGNWEHRVILNRLHHLDWLGDEAEAHLAAQRQILWQAREARIKPGWDYKVLADWNGLMITALARAGTAFDRPDWIAAAESAFAFVATTLSAGGGRLFHGWRDGSARITAMLDDYAQMARGALALFEITGDGGYLARARDWAGVLDRHYWDAVNGGYFLTADDAPALIVRSRSVADNATPAGNGAMVEVLTRLYHHTGEAAYRDRAEQALTAFAGELSRNYFPLTTWLNGFDLYSDPLQIVVAGPPLARAAFVREIHDHCLPNLILIAVEHTDDLPSGHPAAGKPANAVYLCRGQTCSLPITELDALRQALTPAAPGQQ